MRITENYLKFFLTRTIELITNLFCDQIHVASELDTKRYLPLERKKVKIVPNWVEISVPLTPKKSKASIFVGRLEQQKGIEQLLLIWPLREHLTIVGKGPLKSRLQIISSRKLKVDIVTTLDHTDLMELIQCSNVS